MSEIQNASTQPYAQLTPDRVLDAVESVGLITDARIYPLNSYENRVYQVGIEAGSPIIAKFYRPNRWSDAQILEEHQFSLALAELEIPVVPPIVHNGETLFQFDDYRFALYERRAGHAPELDDDDNLYMLGQQMGRIHAVGRIQPFKHRPQLSLADFGEASRDYLLGKDFIPRSLVPAYSSLAEDLIAKMRPVWERIPYAQIRLHGDCHPGNILWRDGRYNFVDLDDARNGPAIQDLWMVLSGERSRQQVQLDHLLGGYQEFCDFDPRELQLIETLRTLRLMQYAAWLARRWDDPAFPMHFPWFNTEHYWSQHILQLREQLWALDEPSITLIPY